MAARYLEPFFKKRRLFIIRVTASKVDEISEKKPSCWNIIRGYLKREQVNATYFIE